MKLVLAFIPPERLQAVVEALVQRHVHGLSVSEARGFGQEHDVSHPEHLEFRGLEMTRKTRLEVICQDHELETTLDAVYQAAHTGRRGAGKVFVIPVEDALRLKTGERGPGAVGPGSST